MIQYAHQALFQNNGANDLSQKEALQSDAAALDGLIAFDIGRYYPDGFGPVGRVFDESLAGWPYSSPPDSVLNLLPSATLDDINNQRDKLVDGSLQTFDHFTAAPIRANFDGQGPDEWLVEVAYPAYGIHDWLPLRLGSNGKYQIVAHDWRYISDATGANGEVKIADLTGDRRTEVVLARWQYLAGIAPGLVTVYRWNGARLAQFGEVDLKAAPPQWGGASAEYELADHDHDGLPDIQVVTPVFWGFDCVWKKTGLFGWPGGQLRHTSHSESEPQTASCAIADARQSPDLAGRSRGFETALARLKPDDPADLYAWVTVRLAESYAAQGREAEATRTLRMIAALQGSGPFADLARQAVATAGSSVLKVCDSLHEAAARQGPNNYFDSAIGDFVALGGYPVSGGPSPSEFCPLGELVQQALKRAHIGSDQMPEGGLAALGYEVVVGQLFQWQGQSHPIWIGVLKLTSPPVIAGERLQDGWHFRVIDYLLGPVTSAKLAAYALNPGGPDGVLLAAVYADPVTDWVYPHCQAGQSTIWFESIQQNGNTPSMGHATSLCGDAAQTSLSTADDRARVAALITEAAAHNPSVTPPRPAWVTLDALSTRPAGKADVFAYVDDLHVRVLKQSKPSAQNEIVALLNYLPPNDAAAQVVAERLRYLAGLDQELSGHSYAAVQAYLALIAEAPQSPWSWLAWARLEPAKK